MNHIKVWNKQISPIDQSVAENTRDYLNTLTKPPGSLGRLEDLSIQLSSITGKCPPTISPAGVLIFAADHGVVEEGVSAFPQDLTIKMMKNFLHGGAAINVFAKQIQADFRLIDIGAAHQIDDERIYTHKIRKGTANFCKQDAMTKDEAIRAIQVGFEEAEKFITEQNLKCLILGEMGIGNTTASSAILSVMSNENIKNIVGPGTGLSHSEVEFKREIIEQALQERKPKSKDPIDILSKVGGLEIAGLTGAMLAAATQRIPILVDGLICSTAAVIAKTIAPLSSEYMFVGHCSAEPGHRIAIKMLEKDPLLQLGMHLGEGSGAALAYPILKSASAILHDMATFSDLKKFEEESTLDT